MPFPFEVPFEKVREDLDVYVDAIFGALQSEFLTMPKGDGFLEFPAFESAYESLKRATASFRKLQIQKVIKTVHQTPVSLIVLRTILGFTPPEWAYVASQRTGTEVPLGAARALDRRIRMKPSDPIKTNGAITEARIKALVTAACELLREGVPRSERTSELIHRLDKADTRDGLSSIQPMADLGVPYAMLLYERFLGRPFAGHRDSVSELIGDVLEAAIESALNRAKISNRKTKRAERVTGFDQAPDFIIPNEFNPHVVIEAKITEDDGTARDKITRVQHLSALSTKDLPPNSPPRFEVIACIAGRGFRVRREDMKKLIVATRGKVFTMQTIASLVEFSALKGFVSR